MFKVCHLPLGLVSSLYYRRNVISVHVHYSTVCHGLVSYRNTKLTMHLGSRRERPSTTSGECQIPIKLGRWRLGVARVVSRRRAVKLSVAARTMDILLGTFGWRFVALVTFLDSGHVHTATPNCFDGATKEVMCRPCDCRCLIRIGSFCGNTRAVPGLKLSLGTRTTRRHIMGPSSCERVKLF